MDNHRGQCPHEPVKCPFSEAGCKENIPRHQLESHMTSNQQQHLLLVMNDLHQVKSKLNETEAKLSETEAKLSETEAKLSKTEAKLNGTEDKLKSNLITAFQFLSQGKEMDKFSKAVDFLVACTGSKRLMTDGDTLEITMSNFSEYHRSGKVWHSPPFYYREGYKMCLSVYANGMGAGARTHVSVGLVLLRGELDDQIKLPTECPYEHSIMIESTVFFVCSHWLARNKEEIEITREETFCDVVSCRQHLVNDCLTIKLRLADNSCYLLVSVA